MPASSASARKRRHRIIGRAGDREKPLDQRAGLARQRVGGAELGLLDETVGDLADGAAADRADAGDRQQIGDERMGRLGIGIGQRRKHALVLRAAVDGRQREALEILGERRLAVEILEQAPLPCRREFERRDQRGEQRNVAGEDRRIGDAVMGGGLQPERQRLGIGRRGVGAAEGFDAGLEEFAGARGEARAAVAEHRAEIAEARRPRRAPREAR